MDEKNLHFVGPNHSEFIHSAQVLRGKWPIWNLGSSWLEPTVLSHKENTEICGVPRGQPSNSETQITRLEVKQSLHWPAKRKERHHMCQKKDKSKNSITTVKNGTVMCVLFHALSCGIEKLHCDWNCLYLYLIWCCMSIVINSNKADVLLEVSIECVMKLHLSWMKL
jgi:hypothetical protein